MVHENIIPMRGLKEDWSGDKEVDVLEKKKDYAKTLIKNQLLGYPNFSEFKGFLTSPKETDDNARDDEKVQVPKEQLPGIEGDKIE
jgi:hypothetical protein